MSDDISTPTTTNPIPSNSTPDKVSGLESNIEIPATPGSMIPPSPLPPSGDSQNVTPTTNVSSSSNVSTTNEGTTTAPSTSPSSSPNE